MGGFKCLDHSDLLRRGLTEQVSGPERSADLLPYGSRQLCVRRPEGVEITQTDDDSLILTTRLDNNRGTRRGHFVHDLSEVGFDLGRWQTFDHLMLHGRLLVQSLTIRRRAAPWPPAGLRCQSPR